MFTFILIVSVNPMFGRMIKLSSIGFVSMVPVYFSQSRTSDSGSCLITSLSGSRVVKQFGPFGSSESSGFGSDVVELGYRVRDIHHLCYGT